MTLSIPKTMLAIPALIVVFASTGQAQDPGETIPSLEALVANSSEIGIVRVKSFQLDEKGNKLLAVQFLSDKPLKRPMKLPGLDASQVANPKTQTIDLPPAIALEFDDEALVTFRYYHQGYWSYDLSSPITMLPDLIPQWHKDQTPLMLFSGFQSAKSGQLHFLIDPGKDSVCLSNWSSVALGEAITQKTIELVELYRGVEKTKLILIDTYHFKNAAMKLASNDGITVAFPGARAMLVPFDSRYEKLLVEQIKDPGLLYGDSYTTSLVDWVRYTSDIYHFDGQKNREFLGLLLQDPQIGGKQKLLLEKILELWGVND